MKNTVLIFLALFTTFAACQNAQPKAEAKPETTAAPIAAAATSETVYACPMHPEITGKKGDKCSKCNMDLKPVETSQNNDKSDARGVVTAYVSLKNALTTDNSTDAATAGKALQAALTEFGKSTMTAEQKKAFDGLSEDASEHAEHIGANGGNIEHQREHFDLLSKDMIDFVKAFGGGRVLYQDFCPMYNKGKGASWLSETEDIKNPYYGKKMQTCGKVQAEIKQ